jgi:tRNA(fMet)-specific endonuclease VapC
MLAALRLLDTNLCIGILKDRVDLIARLRSFAPAEIRICAVVRAELFYGARKSERVEHNLAGLRRFLAPLDSLPFDDRAAEEYGLIRADLERAGTPIGPNDLLIAATARAHDCILVTRNTREFTRIVGLRVENWDD